MLDEAIEFLERRSSTSEFHYEIIVVSDGSTDSTVKFAQGYSKKLSCDKVRVLDLDPNRGKGGAVRLVSFQVTQHIYSGPIFAQFCRAIIKYLIHLYTHGKVE